MIGTNNPISMMTKSVEQFRTGVTGFIDAVQSFRQTMDNLNAMTQRMNRLLDDMEGPIRAVVPRDHQVGRQRGTDDRPDARAGGAGGTRARSARRAARRTRSWSICPGACPRRSTSSRPSRGRSVRSGQMAELAGGLFGNAARLPGNEHDLTARHARRRRAGRRGRAAARGPGPAAQEGRGQEGGTGEEGRRPRREPPRRLRPRSPPRRRRRSARAPASGGGRGRAGRRGS